VFKKKDLFTDFREKEREHAQACMHPCSGVGEGKRERIFKQTPC